MPEISELAFDFSTLDVYKRQEFFLHILGDAVVKGVARHRQAGRLDPASHADDSNIGGAAADVHDLSLIHI